jgi:hypothetical protein
MNDVLNNLSSASWWIGVVVVGIIINIVSVYIKAKLDSRLTKASSWWQRRSVVRTEKRKKEIEKLRESHHEQVMLAIAALRDRMRCVVFLSCGFTVFVLMLLTPYSFLSLIEAMILAIASICLSIGYIYLLSGLNKEGLLNEARKEDENGNIDEPAT